MPSGIYIRTKPVWNKGLTKENDEREKNASDKIKQYCKNNPIDEKEKERLKEIGKKGRESQKRNGTGFFDKKILSEAGKKTQRLHPYVKNNLTLGSFKELKKTNPERLREICSKAGKRANELHPDLAKNRNYKNRDNMGFAFLKKHNPERFKEIQKKAIEKIKEKHPKKIKIYKKKEEKLSNFAYLKINNPEKLKEIINKAKKKIKEFNRLHPNYRREIGKKVQEKHRKNGTRFYNPELASESGKISRETIRKNSPYIWKEVNFMSKQEREVAKVLLDKPIVNVNCHIYIKNKIIDFFIRKKLFVEYHPYDHNGRNKEQYKKQRLDIINNSEFKGISLYVIDNQYGSKRFWEQIEEIKKLTSN